MGAGFMMQVEDRLVEEARKLRPFLEERATETEAARQIGDDIVRALDHAGLWAAAVPRRWGGRAASATTIAHIGAELAKGCPATGWVFYVLTSGAWLVSLGSDPLQEEVFGRGIPRICSGARPGGLIEPVAGGYILNGRWDYTSGAHNAGWALYMVERENADGTRSPAGRICVPMDKVEILDNWRSVGMKGTGSHSTVVKDLFVPAHCLMPPGMTLGEFDSDKRHVGEASDFWPVITALRSTILGPILGMGEAILERVTALARRRPLALTDVARQADSSNVQAAIGRAAARLGAARVLMERSTRAIDAAAAIPREMTYLERTQSRGEASLAVELITETVDKLMHFAGSSAFMENAELQRYWRDVNNAARHASLMPEVGYEIYGRAQLGIEPNLVPSNFI